MSAYKKIVVKVGSNVVAGPDGLPDEAVMSALIDQLAQARQDGAEVVLVSSGAVASGRSLLPAADKADPVARRQVLAAIGQVRLLDTYARLLAPHGLLCAQILVTKEDFRDRQHYLNMERCLEALLQNGVLPILNENDVVSVTELMFTDNDELAGLVASLLGADALLILTNVDGIYDRPPAQPGATVIPVVEPGGGDLSGIAAAEKSSFGRGGMITKAGIARKLARMGIRVHIANGRRPGIVTALLRGEAHGTLFATDGQPSRRKRWVADSEGYAKGRVRINAGAAARLRQPGRAASLLPVGVVAVEGTFQKGDVIRIADQAGELIGLGKAEYGADAARACAGEKNKKPLVHYDYLFLV